LATKRSKLVSMDSYLEENLMEVILAFNHANKVDYNS